MAKRDPKDGEIGIVGYEINFNRYFYRYTPPRPLEGDRSRHPHHRGRHRAHAGRGDGKCSCQVN
jgi:hypothetical protein